MPAAALADGQDILLDFDDNGQVDGCYTLAEFDEALRLARADEQQYGAAVDIIAEARVTNVERPGEPCGADEIPAADPASDSDDGGGVSTGVVIGIIIVVAILLAIGAALIARRRSGGPGDGGSGPETPAS